MRNRQKKKYFLSSGSEFARPGEADQEHLDELGHSRLADAIYEKLAG